MSAQDVTRYMDSLHAVQTGVAHQMHDPNVHETEPKHLRVGVNSAMVTDRALATLLIAKGVFTQDEYEAALADAAEVEAADYTQRVRKQYGNDAIHLL